MSHRRSVHHSHSEAGLAKVMTGLGWLPIKLEMSTGPYYPQVITGVTLPLQCGDICIICCLLMREQWTQRRKWQRLWPAVRLFPATWRWWRKYFPAVIVSATVQCLAIRRHSRCRRCQWGWPSADDRAPTSQASSLPKSPSASSRCHQQRSRPVHLGQLSLIC